MTPEAALAKLHYLLSQDLTMEAVRSLMQQDLRGELTH
jgi:L-asparaginase